MIAQYLASLGELIPKNHRGEMIRLSILFRLTKKGYFISMLVEKLCIVVQKYVLRQCFRLKLVVNLFSMFRLISGSCSYEKIVLQSSVWPMCPYLPGVSL